MKKQVALLFLLATLTAAASPAFAQCENVGSASNAIQNAAQDNEDSLNDYISEVENFAKQDLTNTATYEMKARLDEFDSNIRSWLQDWWDNRLFPSMKTMTRQLSVAQVDQTRQIGSMTDAMQQNDTNQKKRKRNQEAYHRYLPAGVATCQADTTAPQQTKAYQVSRALNRGMTKDAAKTMSNAKGTPAATGRAAEMKSQWDEYVSTFCDPANGDQGCGTTPGARPGANKDMSNLLWGQVQTIDLSSPENVTMVSGALRTFASPAADNPIPPTAVDTATGHQSILDRRADIARRNAVYNVVAQMMAERISVPADTSLSSVFKSMRTGAGLPASAASDNPSYSELRQAITKERFSDPDYLARLINSPEEVIREQGSINALRLQLMNDLYRRQEEMLFMEAAMYGHDLDRQKPPTAVSAGTIQ